MRPSTPKYNFAQRTGPSSPPATPTTASFNLSGKKARRQGAIFHDFPTIPPELHTNAGTIISNDTGTTFSYNPYEALGGDLSPRSSSPTSSRHSESSDEDRIPADRPRSTSPVDPISESPPKHVRINIIKEGNFTVEEFRESDYEGFDSDSESVLRPHQYEDAESEKARSTRASSPYHELDDGVVNGLRDLDCGTEEQDVEERERTAWLEKQRQEKRRKRRSSGSVKKRNILESIGSDTDDEDLKPVMFEGANEAGSSARRLRRKVAGERTSLIFDDPPVGRIVEESEPESVVAGEVVERESESEGEDWAKMMPFYGGHMDVDTSSEEEEDGDE